VHRRRGAGEVALADPVARAIRGLVFSCTEEDDLATAQGIMRRQRVRRLPVLDARGRLAGVLSLQDLARCAMRTGDARLAREVALTLASAEPGGPGT
jgi:CBS-domain-containing membrane protein